MSTLNLEKLLEPRSIVVIGASARLESVGFKISKNLMLGGYTGSLWLVNPRYRKILDRDCLPNLQTIPEIPDLAIVLTPSKLFKTILSQCAKKGIRIAMVMTGTKIDSSLKTFAQTLGIRIIGPYSKGLIRPSLGLNASPVSNPFHEGSLALVSQSSSLGAAMLDWAKSSNVGFSAVLLAGKDIDITLSDLIDILTEDYRTKAIIVYVERVKEARSFLSALSAAARIKPVVLMRSTKEGARFCDVNDRSGHIYSSDSVFQTALSRAGVVRIRTFQNLYAAAKILSTGARVTGNSLAIVSNGAAPAMMAVERLDIKQFHLPSVDEATRQSLNNEIGSKITGSNPFVIRTPENLAQQYVKTIKELDQLDHIDGILIIFIPDSRNKPESISKAILNDLPKNKPTLVCWMGDTSVLAARNHFSESGVSSFRTPESAVDGFDFLHRYHFSQQQLLQLPNPASRNTQSDASSARSLIQNALLNGQRVLDADSTTQLFKLFDIDVDATALKTTQQADSIERHRHLNVSVFTDATFGPVLSVAIGSPFNTISSKRSVQLPPLNQYLAEELLQQTGILVTSDTSRALETASTDVAIHVLRKLSEMVCELPELFSLHIKPLIMSSNGAVATNVQVVLQKAKTQKPYEHLAIHPYPWQWIRTVKLKDNDTVQLRPIRPEDAMSIIALVREMSAESRYFRFMHAVNELSPQMTAQFTKLDYDRQMALVATNNADEITGVSRYVISSDRQQAEFAISISEQWKGKGLASALMRLLIEHAREQGLKTMYGDVLPSNVAMQYLMKSLGFKGTPDLECPDTLRYQITL